MKKDNTLKFQNQIEKIIGYYSTISDSEYIVTDFHIVVDRTKGSFQIFNDDELLLSNDTIDEWCDSNDDSKSVDLIEKDIKNYLEILNKQDYFNQLDIYKPFSFLLENENHEIISELLVVSDDEIIVNDELLKGLDEELNNFINELLKD